MRSIYKRVIQPVIFMAAVFSGSSAYAEKSEYVGQNVIDSLVDRAFFILNSAGDPASGLTQGEAVSSAKTIAVRLRKIAESDPNRKYILFRTGELENQIYLEEEGLLMEKEKYRQKSANDLVPLFNAELGRQRPDFKNLWSIQKQMAAIDANMAIDVENSIRKRASALAKEAPFFFETDLDEGKTDDARSELAYCQVNGAYLGLSPSRCATLEAKLNAKVNSDDERELVIKALERFKTAVKCNNLSGARTEYRYLGGKIKALRSAIQSYEWVRLNRDFELFTSKFERKTDSLCAVAVTLLHKRGPGAASAFIDTMRITGVDAERVNGVEQMVLETVVAEKQRARMASTTADAPEAAAVESDSGQGNQMLDDLLALARKRAKEKDDSLATVRRDLGRTTQIEEVRRERLRVVFELQRMHDQDLKTTDSATALRELVAIYTSVEKRDGNDARKRFAASKELLRKNLPKEDFDRVAEAVENCGLPNSDCGLKK
jgi:hypothetical protein